MIALLLATLLVVPPPSYERQFLRASGICKMAGYSNGAMSFGRHRGYEGRYPWWVRCYPTNWEARHPTPWQAAHPAGPFYVELPVGRL